MIWPDTEFHVCLMSAIEAIFHGKKGQQGVNEILCSVQRKGIKGLYIQEYEKCDFKYSRVAGCVKHSWLYDNHGIREVPVPKNIETYDRISSPYPVLSYAIDEDGQRGIIDYYCGPRAARTFPCKLAENDGMKYLEFCEGIMRIA